VLRIQISPVSDASDGIDVQPGRLSDGIEPPIGELSLDFFEREHGLVLLVRILSLFTVASARNKKNTPLSFLVAAGEGLV
jgi:hypothetical protein